MKKTIAFLLSLFSCVTIINAQEMCSTPSPEPPQWIFNPSLRSVRVNKLYRINIFVHIVRSGNDKGASPTIAPSIINDLNGAFANARIQFVLLGSDFINSNNSLNPLYGKEKELFKMNAHTNAIDIYVVPEDSWTRVGIADSIPSTALIVRNDHRNTSALPHEMGHCLGLYHTHHGTWDEKDSNDKRQCQEFVDGSNSTTCGDYISDTPADPCIWSTNTCAYTGIIKDGHKQKYSPDASNYMSYANPLCRTKFTNGQIERMKRSIDTTAILQRVLCELPFVKMKGIEQGAYLKSRRTIHVSVSTDILQGVNSYRWEGANCRILSGQGTPSVSIQVDNNPYTDDLPFNIQLYYANACDSKRVRVDGFIIGKPRPSFSLFPNPATDVVTLKLTKGGDGVLSSQGQGSLTTKGVTSTYEIQLWSGLTMLKSFRTNQLTFQIPIAGLSAGLYFVRVIKDGQTYTEKLIKN